MSAVVTQDSPYERRPGFFDYLDRALAVGVLMLLVVLVLAGGSGALGDRQED